MRIYGQELFSQGRRPHFQSEGLKKNLKNSLSSFFAKESPQKVTSWVKEDPK